MLTTILALGPVEREVTEAPRNWWSLISWYSPFFSSLPTNRYYGLVSNRYSEFMVTKEISGCLCASRMITDRLHLEVPADSSISPATVQSGMHTLHRVCRGLAGTHPNFLGLRLTTYTQKQLCTSGCRCTQHTCIRHIGLLLNMEWFTHTRWQCGEFLVT